MDECELFHQPRQLGHFMPALLPLWQSSIKAQPLLPNISCPCPVKYKNKIPPSCIYFRIKENNFEDDTFKLKYQASGSLGGKKEAFEIL
jgi:hypothetical protein